VGSRGEAALKAWKTRRIRKAFVRARASEVASKEAFRAFCEKKGWRVAFFEGWLATNGIPRQDCPPCWRPQVDPAIFLPLN
jgi:hypothetical protein